MMRILAFIWLFVTPCLVYSGEWCDINPGFAITENSGNFTIKAVLKDPVGSTKHYEWLRMDVIGDEDASKARFAMLMSARIADKSLKIYTKDYTCTTLTNWTAGQILHVRL